MNEKEVLIRIVDSKNDRMIRATYTSIPSQMLKMYHYMKDKEGLFLHLDASEDEGYYDTRYDDVDCEVTDVEVVPGGQEFLNCINVYIKVLGAD